MAVIEHTHLVAVPNLGDTTMTSSEPFFALSMADMDPAGTRESLTDEPAAHKSNVGTKKTPSVLRHSSRIFS